MTERIELTLRETQMSIKQSINLESCCRNTEWLRVNRTCKNKTNMLQIMLGLGNCLVALHDYLVKL